MDSAFGTVEDGDELFAKFNTFSSSSAEDVGSLIADLQLEQKKMNPLSFAELLLLLHTKEDKCTAKATHMKQHLGASKQRVLSHSQRAWMLSESEPDVVSLTTETQKLKKQIAELQRQLTTSITRCQKSKKEFQKETTETTPTREQRKSSNAISQPQTTTNKTQRGKPKPWCCFTCGDDGHIASACDN